VDKEEKNADSYELKRRKRINKFFIVLPLTLSLLTGCKEANEFIEVVVDKRSAPETIESGLSPEDVVSLYLTLSGHGKYVLAYELMTDEQKQRTVEDIKRYSELGTAELEKIIGVQQQDVSLVTAVIKYTDQETQEVRYKVKEFVLMKEDEWRIVEPHLLDKSKLKTITGLIAEQANAIKNSPETKELILWMQQKQRHSGCCTR
jgi:hypothetical protein